MLVAIVIWDSDVLRISLALAKNKTSKLTVEEDMNNQLKKIIVNQRQVIVNMNLSSKLIQKQEIQVSHYTVFRTDFRVQTEWLRLWNFCHKSINYPTAKLLT